MNETEFAKAYLQYEENIKKVLNSKKIYDEDLLHDTYIALFDHQPHPAPCEFVNTFITFYNNLLKRRDENESHYDCYDHTHMLDFDRIDESDLAYREKIGRRIDSLLRYYVAHPQPGERNHKRACKVLRLYCQGYNECEISNKLKISQSAVSQSIDRAIERLKLIAK